jgi:DNA-binding CsgD family transcriptional regulator
MGGRARGADLNGLIDRIYEAALLPDAWPKALADLTELADAAFASIFTFDGSVLRWTGTPEAIALIDSYKSVETITPNSRIPRALRIDMGFFTDFDLLSRAEIEADPFYTEFLRPRGYGWAVGTYANLPSGESLIISAERRFERGPVETEYVRLLDGLRPHYARAAMLAARLELERAAAMTRILDLLRLPAAVLKANGSLFAANDSFSELAPAVFQDRRTRLTAKDQRADSMLETALAWRSGDHRGVRSFPVPSSDERPAMVVHLVPVCGEARDIFSRGVNVLVVTPIDRRKAPQASVLQGLFDLTPSEARVAKGVAEAHSVDAIALSLGLSRETVRTRLKSILAKTGLHRQSELANLLAGMAVER